MMEYFINYHAKLLGALAEHLTLVGASLALSLLLAASLTVLCVQFKPLGKWLVSLFSMVYSIPSLALFALLIPLTGLGFRTALIVLTLYNQYLLLRNFLAGLGGVDPAIVEAATGMGMTKMQALLKIQLLLSRAALMTGVRLAAISTIGIATIAASINAGGLGAILFDGLRTLNVSKIAWGSILSAGLAIVVNVLLGMVEGSLNGKRGKG